MSALKVYGPSSQPPAGGIVSSPVIIWTARCRLPGGHLHSHPGPPLVPGSGQTWPLAWVGSQASRRGSQAMGMGVETTSVAHPLKTLGTMWFPILWAALAL